MFNHNLSYTKTWEEDQLKVFPIYSRSNGNSCLQKCFSDDNSKPLILSLNFLWVEGCLSSTVYGLD